MRNGEVGWVNLSQCSWNMRAVGKQQQMTLQMVEAAVEITAGLLRDISNNFAFILCVSGRYWRVNLKMTQFHLPFTKVSYVQAGQSALCSRDLEQKTQTQRRSKSWKPELLVHWM